jgi:hypothetical protein
VTGFNTNPDHLRRSGGMLSKFGQTVANAGDKLDTAGGNLVEHAKADRSGIGAVVARLLGRGVQITGKVFKEGGRVADKAGQNLGKTGDLHEEADHNAKSLIDRHHPDNKSKHLPGEGTRTASAVTDGGKKSDPKKLPKSDERTPDKVGEGEAGKKDKDPHFSGDLNDPPGATRISSASTDHMPPPSLDTSPRKLADLKGAPGVATDENGLITHVGDRTAKQYVTDVGEHRANQYRAGQQQAKQDQVDYQRQLGEHKQQMQAYREEKQAWVEQRKQEAAAAKAEGREPHFPPEPKMPEKPTPPSTADQFSQANVGVTAVAMDRRTGLVYEGINGSATDSIPDANLHPTLRQHLNDMTGKPGGYPVEDDTTGATRDHPHPDNPLGHAEVKAVNALLWERNRQGLDDGPGALAEMRVDNYHPFRSGGIEQAPCCANCNLMLRGVPSNAGRYDRFPPGDKIPE